MHPVICAIRTHPIFKDCGGQHAFSGLITTVKDFKDYMILRTMLEEFAALRRVG